MIKYFFSEIAFSHWLKQLKWYPSMKSKKRVNQKKIVVSHCDEWWTKRDALYAPLPLYWGKDICETKAPVLLCSSPSTPYISPLAPLHQEMSLPHLSHLLGSLLLIRCQSSTRHPLPKYFTSQKTIALSKLSLRALVYYFMYIFIFLCLDLMPSFSPSTWAEKCF